MGRISRTLGVMAVAAAMAVGAWLGGFLSALTVVPPPMVVPEGVVAPDNFPVFSEVWGIVRKEFRGTQPAADDVTFASVRGLLENIGDPYAEFQSANEIVDPTRDAPPDVARSIGAWIEPAPEGARVVSTIPGSPARQAGLRPGVLVLAVDGEPAAGLPRSALLAKLDGSAGSSVILRVFAGNEPSDVELVRYDTPMPLVEVREMDGSVGYLRVSHFERGTVLELDAALDQLASGEATALVLDLRDNPGGDLAALRDVASRFVLGPLWVERRRSGDVTVQSVPGQPVSTFNAIAVLVNEGTAAAAEMLAGLLRETSGASLVGSQTFGKPTIQGMVRLSDGSAMRLSLATWATPGGIDVTQEGLTPDREVPDEDDQLSAATDTALGRSGG